MPQLFALPQTGQISTCLTASCLKQPSLCISKTGLPTFPAKCLAESLFNQAMASLPRAVQAHLSRGDESVREIDKQGATKQDEQSSERHINT